MTGTLPRSSACPIVEVVKGGDVTKGAFTAKDDKAIMVNSGFLNGMTVKEAIPPSTSAWSRAGARKGEFQAP